LDVESIMASPNTFSGLHSTIALTGAEFSPATPNGANDPGLDNQTVVSRQQPKGVNMTGMHWVLIAVALLAIWYFFFRTPSATS
jgi:hypothetical protein